MTKGDLYQHHIDISTFNKTITLLLKGRINDFYKEYSGRIKTIIQFITALQNEYYHIEDGKFKIETITIADHTEERKIMNAGKTEDEFKTKLNDYLSEPLITFSKNNIIHLH